MRKSRHNANVGIIVEADRAKATARSEPAEAVCVRVGRQRRPSGRVLGQHVPSSSTVTRASSAQASALCRWVAITASITGSSEMRRIWWDLVGPTMRVRPRSSRLIDRLTSSRFVAESPSAKSGAVQPTAVVMQSCR